MTWSLYGERLETADMSGSPRVYQPISFDQKRNVKAFKTWIVYFNTPAFTALYLDVYSNRSELPGSLLFRSSKSWTTADVSSDSYAAKELWFDFDNPISFKKEDTYHLALYASDYTGNSNTHIAWIRGIPDPNNTIDISINTKNISRTPFYLGVIDELR